MTFLETDDVVRVQDITPDHLRRFLLDQGERRSPGGLHGPQQDRQGVPAMVGGRDPEREGWRSPIEKVPAPRATMETLDPLNL